MRFLVAMDSFRGSLTSREAGEAAKRGILRARPGDVVDVAIVSDGGEGLVDAVRDALGGRIEHVRCEGPLGDPVDAGFLILPDGTAVVETARSSGQCLVERPDAWNASSRGVGQQIRAALDRGARRILVGAGGSATNDAGTGMAEALGVRFLDERGGRVVPAGRRLADIHDWDLTGLDARCEAVDLRVLVDVDSPLVGPAGASRVFAPQKGAGAEQVDAMEEGMRSLARLMQRRAGRDVASMPGAGAAGGLAAGVVSFLGGTIVPGLPALVELTGLADRVAAADVLVTGEGRLDSQSLRGKLPVALARIAATHGTGAWAVVGDRALSDEEVASLPFDEVASLSSEAGDVASSMSGAAGLVEKVVAGMCSDGS